MGGEVQKLEDSIIAAPIGAIGGAVFGYFLAKRLGYDKNISVISFMSVGLIIGAAIGATVGSKLK